MKKTKEIITFIFDGDIFGFWEAVYLFYNGLTKWSKRNDFMWVKGNCISSITTNPYKIKGICKTIY